MDIASMVKDVNIYTLKKVKSKTDKRPEVIANNHIPQKVQTSKNLQSKIQIKNN
jgi:hypothetical protein